MTFCSRLGSRFCPGKQARRGQRLSPEKRKSYYLLLQIAFELVPLLDRGSLLRHLAAAFPPSSTLHRFSPSPCLTLPYAVGITSLQSYEV